MADIRMMQRKEVTRERGGGPPRPRRWRSRVGPILFVLPAVMVLLAISIFPLLYTLWLSVMSWMLGIAAQPTFVGLENFARILQDGRFWNAMRVTAFLMTVGVGLQLVLGTGLALVVNQLRRFRTLITSLLLIPVMIPPVIAGFQFRMIYHADLGPLNYLLGMLTGGHFGGKAWLADPAIALPAVMMVDVWQWTPFMILIILAGLQAISPELYDAAEVDGASGWQVFWRITFPLLLPIIVIGILIRFMDAFRLFDIIFQLTGGGPGAVTESIAFYSYLQGFRHFNMGYTAAMAFVQLIVIIIIAKVFLKVSAQREAL